MDKHKKEQQATRPLSPNRGELISWRRVQVAFHAPASRLVPAESQNLNSTLLLRRRHHINCCSLSSTATMSSPTSRRSNRNSVNGTPRRSQRSSAAPMSDAPLPDANGADEQLQSESSQQDNTTPRGNARSSQITSQSQAPPTSSPLFFRSSPAGSQSQSQSQGLNAPAAANGANASFPLRQQSDAASSQGGRTPRASGAIGGEMSPR